MSEKLKILLVDDHVLFRSGIRLLLQGEADFAIVGEAADGLEAVKCAHQLKPDIVLLDLNLPGLSGLEALRLIKEDTPECAVMMLTVSEDALELACALRGGADGYVLKNAEASYLVDAMRKVVRGESVVSPDLVGKLVGQLREGSKLPVATPGPSMLTPREKEVVQCLTRGESNKVIARNLNLSESTVKIHVQNILKKLGLSSRVQIAIYALEQGWAATPDSQA
ncbi:response regulator [Uliginosibacterium gangwonense]|uniref:response regulator n=1 Tax=Uliginosibacterium gangwonense TaxID=392736 RepID=UPI0003731037|nr:response regulator transcription factor [Uliginosibacterium gangwonense]